MEGKGFPEPVAYQVGQAQYRDRYTRFIRAGDHGSFTAKLEASLKKDPKQPLYDWSVREDVWVNFLGRRGDLTVGYGVPAKCFGPEFNFGHVVGDHFGEQVLLIKTAWGGKSLGRDFLSPSSGLPTEEDFAAMVEEKNAQTQRNNRKNPDKAKPLVTAEELEAPYGHFYREMLVEVRDTLADLENRFPSYAGQGYEIAGLVWFQGWNDQFNDEWSSRYGEYLANFIRDVRRDLEVPDLPVVIGVIGFDGLRESPRGKDGGDSPRVKIQNGQAALAELPEFEGNVRIVQTKRFWDMDAEAIYRGEGGWSADIEKWHRFGNERPYHYYGSPWFFAQAGTAFGTSMLELLSGD